MNCSNVHKDSILNYWVRVSHLNFLPNNFFDRADVMSHRRGPHRQRSASHQRPIAHRICIVLPRRLNGIFSLGTRFIHQGLQSGPSSLSYVEGLRFDPLTVILCDCVQIQFPSLILCLPLIWFHKSPEKTHRQLGIIGDLTGREHEESAPGHFHALVHFVFGGDSLNEFELRSAAIADEGSENAPKGPVLQAIRF